MFPTKQPRTQPAPTLGAKETWYYNEVLEYFGGWVEGASSGEGSQSKELNYLYMQAEDSDRAWKTYVTDIAVDLTNIQTLYVDWENIGISRSYFNISTDKMGSWSARDAGVTITTSGFSRTVNTVDVSNLLGNYYIRFHAVDINNTTPNNSELLVYKVWGER